MGQLKAGYKRTEVGVIPDTWEVRKISSFGRTEGGYAFKSSNFLGNGKYQIIKMSNVYGGNLDLRRSESFLDFLDSAEMNYLLKNGDILITLTGTVGKKDYGYTYLITNQKNLLLNQRVARIVTTKEVDFRFIFFQTKMPYFANQFFESAKGGTGNQANVGTQQVDEILLPIPPYNEQRAIADALSDVDALITNLEKLIAKKKAIKQGAMQQLLTPPHKGGKRLEGFSGEWVKRELGTILKVRHGKDQKLVQRAAGKYPIYGTGGFMGYASNYLYDKESVLIGRKGTIDKPRYIDTPFWTVDTLFYTEIFEGFSAKYIYYSFLLIDWYSYNEASGVPSLNAKTIEKISIYLPPTSSEQQNIVNVLSNIDSSIEMLVVKQKKATLLKQGMMQELLTGKTRLI